MNPILELKRRAALARNPAAGATPVAATSLVARPSIITRTDPYTEPAPGRIAAPPAFVPRAEPTYQTFGPPTPPAPQGRSRDWHQYDIGSPQWAELLRDAFGISAGGGFMLASEIVPVYNVNEEGSEPVVPWRSNTANAAAAGARRAFISFHNPANSNRISRITRFVSQVANAGTLYYGITLTEAENIPTDGADVRTAMTIRSFDKRSGQPVTLGFQGSLTNTAYINGLFANAVVVFRGTAATPNWDQNPEVLLRPGESYYLLGSSLVSGDAMNMVWTEGEEEEA